MPSRQVGIPVGFLTLLLIFTCWNMAYAQQTVSGTVTDGQSGVTLPGVNILVKGTTTGTSTDNEGHYALAVPSLQDTLVFSFVGYKTRQVPINGRATINISLETQAISGEEMVVVGYGEQRKEDLTGSIGSVSGEDMERTSVESNTIVGSLQGNVAGVNIKQASNAPGGGLRIRVRGSSSINASSQPLYVIDGVPINNANVQPSGTGNHALPQDPLSSLSLDPSDIASVEVLKDASATAIYGARGANGVVLITTKEGRRGQPKVDFSYNVNVAKVRNKIDLANARELAELTNEWAANNDKPPIYDGENKPLPKELAEGTDWQDQIFRRALTHSAHLSVSAGDKNTRYFISGNYRNEDGIIIESNFQRAGINFNLDQTISNRIDFGLNVKANRSINDAVPSAGTGYQNDTPLINALLITPVIPVKDKDGNYVSNQDETYKILENPVQIARDRTDKTYVNRFLSDLFIDVDLYKELTFKAKFGADVISSKRNVYTPNTARTQALPNNGIASVGTIQNYNVMGEYTLRYDKVFNDNNRLKLLAGFTAQKNNRQTALSVVKDFSTNKVKFNNLGLGSNPRPPTSNATESGLLSYIGRINYTFKDRYIFTGNIRRDGSSKFGSNNKWGVFPSGALAWRMSEERFMKKFNSVSNLKLRASYGITGNEGIGSYRSLTLYHATRPIIGNGPAVGLVPGNISNPDLKWEKTAQFDAGIDMGFFNDKFNLTVDYYRKKTTNILLNIPIPDQSGYGRALKNIGSLENRGIEFSAGLNTTLGKLNWSTSFNISFNRNKALSLSEESDRIILGLGRGEASHGYSIVIPGEPVGEFWGYQFGGIWQSEQQIADSGRAVGGLNRPGLPIYEDLDGSDSFTRDNNDRKIIGDPHPDFIFGWSNHFAYKNFGLSIFINGSYGNDILNMNSELLLSEPEKHNVYKRYYDNHWIGKGTSNTVEGPIVHAGEWKNISQRNVEDGSYLRVKTIRLSYNISTNTLGLQNSQVFVAATNLITVTNYSGFDPEVDLYQSSNTRLGVDNGAYPASKSITFGVKLDF